MSAKRRPNALQAETCSFPPSITLSLVLSVTDEVIRSVGKISSAPPAAGSFPMEWKEL